MRRIASGAPGAARAGVEAGGRAPGARARQVLLQGSEGGDGEGKYLKYAAALLDKVYPGRGMSSSLRLEHVRNMQASDFYKVWKVRPPCPRPDPTLTPARPGPCGLGRCGPLLPRSPHPPGARQLGRAGARVQGSRRLLVWPPSCARAGPRPPAAIPPVCGRPGGGRAAHRRRPPPAAGGRRREARCERVPWEVQGGGQVVGERAARRCHGRARRAGLHHAPDAPAAGGRRGGRQRRARRAGRPGGGQPLDRAGHGHARQPQAHGHDHEGQVAERRQGRAAAAGPPRARAGALLPSPVPPGSRALPRAGRPVGCARCSGARLPGTARPRRRARWRPAAGRLTGYAAGQAWRRGGPCHAAVWDGRVWGRAVRPAACTAPALHPMRASLRPKAHATSRCERAGRGARRTRWACRWSRSSGWWTRGARSSRASRASSPSAGAPGGHGPARAPPAPTG